MEPIYLLSLPRSGSTLTQRLIAAHPGVTTTAEPWILLPFVYALRDEGVVAEYGHSTMASAIQDFTGGLDDGRDDYQEVVAEAVRELYRRAGDPDATYFLDKTPRYHLILDELQAIFPDAPKIVLWRNPLAIAASMVRRFDGQWTLHDNAVDLYNGLDHLVDWSRRHETDVHQVRYENLVQEPDKEIHRIFEFLALEPVEVPTQDLTDVEMRGRMAKETGQNEHEEISTEPLKRWKGTMATPMRKAWCNRYLDWIGDDDLRFMGYHPADLRAQVQELPSRPRNAIADAAHRVAGRIKNEIKEQIGILPEPPRDRP